MKNLYIFTHATSKYKEYLPFFINSLPNLKLKNFNVNLIIISDKKEYNNYLYYPIGHFPYPFNLYLKPFILKNAIEYFNLSDNDYMMFVDVDTIIRKCDNFDNFENCLLSNKMIFSISPWSIYYKCYNENELNKENYEEIYINNANFNDFLQTSFFAGNIKAYIDFEQKYFNICENFIKDFKNKRIPPMNDQSVISKIVYDEKDIYIKDYFLVNTYEYYSLEESNNIKLNDKYIHNSFIIKEHPNVFLIQKFNCVIKESIRYSIS